MHIAFVHDSKSFLPEINAYTEFFSSKGVSCRVISPQQLHSIGPDVYWHFMGTDRRKKLPGTVTIHEYTSASVPPLAGLKNGYKRMTNIRPDYRLFLNAYIESAFGFTDQVPHGYRDMGIPASWLDPPPTTIDKTYDFMYAGELKHRGIEPLLDVFATGTMKQHSLLLVSKDYDALRTKYGAATNILFTGPVPHQEVRTLIQRSRFAINYMPDKAPFNRQTSTKLLEYAACKVPVISSDYYWVRDFQKSNGGNFFYLEKDLSNFSWDRVQSFPYAFPDLSGKTWDQQIRLSGVVDFLEKRFPGLVS